MFFWISLTCFIVVMLAVVMEVVGLIKNVKVFIIVAPIFIVITALVMLQITYIHAAQPVPYHLFPKIGYYAESGWNMLIGALASLEAILITILSTIDLCGGIKRNQFNRKDEPFGDTIEFDVI